jgi:hypothetical protein
MSENCQESGIEEVGEDTDQAKDGEETSLISQGFIE